MRYEIAYQPSYSLAIIDLDPGEEIRCESGAMVSMTADLVLEAKLNAGNNQKGGFLGAALGAVKRSVLGGESFFITSIRATDKPGEATLAPAVPGDIAAMDVTGRALLVQGGSYLASGPGVDVDTTFNLARAAKNFVGGESLFFLRISGNGVAFLTAFGAVHEKTLKPGERYTVDSGHLVAYEEGVNFEVGLAAEQGGFFKRGLNSATTGEGVVMKFTGPGKVWLQTRNPEAFSSWLVKLLPTPQSSNVAAGGALGVVGGLFGGSDD